MSNPSRFDVDRQRLLTAGGGDVIAKCLAPEYNAMQCDVRLADDVSPLVDGTRCILLLGEYAMHKWSPPTSSNTLNEMRGSVLQAHSLPAIASFNPQEAADVKAYEQQLNPESKDFHEDKEGDEDEGEESEKVHSRTKTGNYYFWLRRDVWKCIWILSNRLIERKEPRYKIYPSAKETIGILQSSVGNVMDFDIETDYAEQNLLCFSFSFDDAKTVYSVPVLDHTYKPAYSNLHQILRALAEAIKNNTIVAHNGSGFDFYVLGGKYHIPIYKVYDTMLAMHRCFPDVEKSLGHCMSYWTWLPFHKDTDSYAYRTYDHMMQKLMYCGKDVFGMSLVRQEITKYARTIPGLEASIQCAMESIRPYLTITLQGMRYSQPAVDKTKAENDAWMMQYLRMIRLLMGPTAEAECRASVKGKAKGFAGSNKQCVDYFHRQLGYPVVARSMKTQEPSLGKQAMYKLALKCDNPVIKLVLMYRILSKEYGTLKFSPFKNNDNKIIKPTNTEEESSQSVFSAMGTL